MNAPSTPALDPNHTGATTPLPAGPPGTPGREEHERSAVLSRGTPEILPAPRPMCAPEVAGLQPDLLYTLVAENVRDYAIFLMDRSGIIRCWGESARLMKWWTRQQAEGAHLRLLYPDGGAEDGTAESHLAIAAERGEYNGEGHRVRADGSTLWAYVTLTALRNERGELVGFTKVTRDFSARRAVESTLIKELHGASASPTDGPAMNRISQVVAHLSHELRSPLTAIVGSVALLERRIGEGDPDRPHLDRLQRNSRHLLVMLDDILEMSRAESGHMPLSSSVHRLGPTIADALADVETQANAREIVLTNAVSGAPSDLPYFGDEDRVRQIIVNLLSNAVKFTDPGGRITVSGGTAETVARAALTGEGPWIYLRVEDTGRGIPPDKLQAIFEPFQQSEPADRHRGSGLGLAISRQLARMMGGDLVAESEVGAGSRFTLWLPIAPSDPVPR